MTTPSSPESAANLPAAVQAATDQIVNDLGLDHGDHVQALILRHVEPIVRAVENQRDEARAYGERLYRDACSRKVTCVYCGHEYPDGTPTAQDAALSEHIKLCEKHPLRKALAKLAEAEQWRFQHGDAYQQVVDERDRALAEAQLWKDAHGTQTAAAFDEMVKERDTALSRADQADGLLRAVIPTEFDGIQCDDVNGVNWFDARKSHLASRSTT